MPDSVPIWSTLLLFALLLLWDFLGGVVAFVFVFVIVVAVFSPIAVAVVAVAVVIKEPAVLLHTRPALDGLMRLCRGL